MPSVAPMPFPCPGPVGAAGQRREELRKAAAQTNAMLKDLAVVRGRQGVGRGAGLIREATQETREGD